MIAQQYYDRYGLPVMHTETNIARTGGRGAVAVEGVGNMLRLRQDGVPIVGFTWYSLTDQIDWDIALREDNGRVNPLGLYDLDRKIRPVGTAYKNLAAEWSATPILPNGPLTVISRWDVAAETSVTSGTAGAETASGASGGPPVSAGSAAAGRS